MNKASILIIDDDPILRKTLSDILRAKGLESMTAPDGAAGLEALVKRDIQVALVDLGLPDMPGVELLGKIKADHPRTEVIVLTGNATLESAIAATNRGAFSYLLKPYDIDQLLQFIGQALEKQQAKVELIERNEELRAANVEFQILQDVSQSLSHTLEQGKLLAGVLDVVTRADIFPCEVLGGIFLIKRGRLFLAAQSEGLKPGLRTEAGIFFGKCLCGQAMQTKSVIVCAAVPESPHHAAWCSTLTSHGHIVVPLSAFEHVVGLLVLFVPPGYVPNERVVRLLGSIGCQVGIAINNVKLYEQTRSASLHDPLTGLANRRFMLAQIEKCFEAAWRFGEQLSVVMLDIDHFKTYNDTYGHQHGDRVLVKVAKLLIKELRDVDHVFRYGGEEFLCILPRTGLSMAAAIAERLRAMIETETDVTISLGVASFRHGIASKDGLIKAADAMLYKAKMEGRNRVVLQDE